MASTSDTQNDLRFDKELFKKELQRLVDDHSLDNLFDARVAQLLDEGQGEGEADWRSMRAEYRLPTLKHAGVPGGSDEPAIYLCGNSLGPMTKRTELYVQQELDAWGQKAVLGHWDHPHGRPWTKCEERIGRIMSDMVGAKPSEVIVMSTLTANLHSMLATFYRPGKQLPQSGWSAQASPSVRANYKRRTKILYEAKAFPSDQYALASAVALAGEDPKAALVPLHAPVGSDTISTEDILQALEVHGDEVSMIMLGGLQYITGQLFDLPRITRRAHELGILAGFDLAHAFANVPLALHDWEVDFAVWCTYKYGSSGPGGIAGAFVHERWGDIGMRTHLDRPDAYEGAEGLLRPAGWWGHEKSTRFSMPNSFRSMKGAAGWQLSNPSALDAAALLGSLETLAQVVKGQDVGAIEWANKIESIEGTTAIGSGQIMPRLRPRSARLTAYLELLLLEHFIPKQTQVRIITPADPSQRGSMLSLRVPDVTRADPKFAALETAQAQLGQSQSLAAKGEHTAPTAADRVAEPTSAQTLVSRAHKRAERTSGLIADVRSPDIVRLAPLAQYSTFADVWKAAEAFGQALRIELGLD